MTDYKQIRKLMNLADAAMDFETVDVNLVGLFHDLREQVGLAKLLMLIQEYVTHQCTKKH